VEKLTGTVRNNAVTIMVSSLSPFAVFADGNHNPDTGVPQTGDDTNMGLWIAMLIVSLGFAGLAAWQLVRKRRTFLAYAVHPKEKAT